MLTFFQVALESYKARKQLRTPTKTDVFSKFKFHTYGLFALYFRYPPAVASSALSDYFRKQTPEIFQHNPFTSFFSGFISNGLTQIISSPAELIRSNMIKSAHATNSYPSMLSTAKEVVAQCGILSLFQNHTARMFRASLLTGITTFILHVVTEANDLEPDSKSLEKSRYCK